MKTVAASASVSLRYPISDEIISALIKTGKLESKYAAHMFAFFTDVPVQDIISFAMKSGISLSALRRYYKKYVKPFYPNKALEEAFAYD